MLPLASSTVDMCHRKKKQRLGVVILKAEVPRKLIVSEAQRDRRKYIFFRDEASY